MSGNSNQSVVCQMMIRKPVSEVFTAFIDPSITTQFWFTASSGLLVKGQTVTWEWEMYGVSTEVLVKDIIENEKISIEWGESKTFVDFKFTSLDEHKTYVIIEQYGFTQEGDDLTNAIKDSTGGFTTVLDGLKAYLEHGLKLNLIADKFPHITQK